MTFILFRIANSFKFIGKYGIFRYKSIKTATFQSSVELYLLSRIIYLDVILKFTKKNHEDKLYVVYFSESFFLLYVPCAVPIAIAKESVPVCFTKFFRH